MRLPRAQFALFLVAMTLLSSVSDVHSFPLGRIAEGLNLPVPDMMLGRVTGLMSDWFVNDVPAGITVRKKTVDTKSEADRQAEADADTDLDETRMERLKTRISQIYGTLTSNLKSANQKQSAAHRISRREAAEPKNATEAQIEETLSASVDIPLHDNELNGTLPEVRTYGRNRCVLKLVCKFEDQESSRDESYPARAARYVGDFWERYHPSFLDYFFGYQEVTYLARTDYGYGCFLHHNSCPMRIVNVVMLATALERPEGKSAES